MTDLQTRLRDALRDEEEERLSIDEAAALRRLVVAAALDRGRASARMWLPPLAVAATVVAMLAIGIVMGGRFDARPSGIAPDGRAADLPGARTPGRARQLQFSTPSGTRIIWTFNSDLELKTTP